MAVLLVLMLHFALPVRDATPLVASTVRALHLGWVGVDLFFVLSGCLITGILLDSRDTPHRWRTFFARRTLRIFPLYYLYLAGALVLAPTLLATWTNETGGAAPWLWTYTTNVPLSGSWAVLPASTRHFWSLAVEEQFYLAWPFIVWALSPLALRRLCVSLVVGAALVRVACYEADVALWGYVLTPARMDTLAIGALIAVQARRPEGLHAWRRWIVPAGLAGLAAFLVVALWRGAPPSAGTWALLMLDPYMLAVGYSAMALACGAFVAGAIVFAPIVLARGLLPRCGTIAYGLYVWHVPVALGLSWLASRWLPVAANRYWPMQLAMMAAGLGASFAVATLSYRWFEQPFLRLKDRLAPAVPAYTAM